MDAASSSKNKKSDLSGRDRLLSNVLWGWGSYLVVIIAGFIMPRFIDRYVGQVNLGIWDFSWSLVSYLNYSSMGIGASINRYVAKYRAAYDKVKLQGAVSSVFLIQNGISVFIVVCSAIIAELLPYYFSEKLGDGLDDAQWVVLLLGTSVAVEQAAGTFRGVITGCHRWDIHNILNVSTRIGGFIAMLSVLYLGMGLKALAAAYLIATIFFGLLRGWFAFRVCPELKLSLALANLAQARKMVVFGWKSFVIQIPSLLLLQTSNVLITGVLGPAALAIFARAVALIRHTETVVQRFSFITTPIASVLKTTRELDELKAFFYESCRFGVAITMPIMLLFIFYGKDILQLWMGEQYATDLTLPFLAMGYFLPISLSPAMSILVGINRHGKVGLVNLIIILIFFGIGLGIIEYVGWSLPRCALLVSFPLMLGNGIIIPLFTSFLLNITIQDFVKKIFILPLISNVPLILSLIISKGFLLQGSILVKCCEIFGGGFITLILYFYYILPAHLRVKFLKFR